MTQKTGKNYTSEFLQDAVRLVTEQGYNRAVAARSLGMDAGMLGRRVTEFQESAEGAFCCNGKLTAEKLEIRRLRKENKRLTLEREIRKKRQPSLPKSRV